MSKPRCLLIDDSEEIQLLVQRTVYELCDVTPALTVAEGRKQFEARAYDIVIIDLMLDNSNGMDLLKEFKAASGVNKHSRFFILTGKESSVDEAQGHNYGVDEYIKKPVDREVLKAIVRKNLKVLREEAPEIINTGPLSIIPGNHQAFMALDGAREELQLTVKEFKLLTKLVTNLDKTFSREDLFAQVWDNDSNSTFRTIDMHVSSLRKKLKVHGSLIKTVHQVGYKFSLT